MYTIHVRIHYTCTYLSERDVPHTQDCREESEHPEYVGRREGGGKEGSEGSDRTQYTRTDAWVRSVLGNFIYRIVRIISPWAISLTSALNRGWAYNT